MLDFINTSVSVRSVRSYKAVRFVRVPSDLVLTPRVLLGAVRILPTADIQEVIDVLIDELNLRCGDPDFESEPGESSDPDDDLVCSQSFDAI
jgi:hypothetical protein